MMKKIFCAALVALSIAACSKEERKVSPETEKTATITLDVSPYKVETKNTGDQNLDPSYIDSITRLEFFVFRQDGVLERYKRLSVNDEGGIILKNIPLNVTLGKKYIYAVANSKRSWPGITTREKFLAEATSLKTELFRNITMSAETEVDVTEDASIEMKLKRLVARITVAGISTAFSGGPYDGMTLSNVKLYLTNVCGSKTFMGDDPATPVVLNSKGLVEEDNTGTSMTSIISESVPGYVGAAGYSKPHYFYCYENMIASETDTDKFTRLVLQADLDGKTYYYPVDINRPGYGWTSSVGHQGVKRNTVYAFSFTISGPGSEDPEDKIVLKTITVDTSVEGFESGVNYFASF